MQPSGIIYLSAIPWEFTRQREHEIARRLAGWLPTLYVNPPLLRPGRTSLEAAPRAAGPNLWTLDTCAPVLGYRNSHLLNLWVRAGLVRQVKRGLDTLGLSASVLMVDDVGYEPVREDFGASVVAFDCVDRPWVFRKVASVRLLKRYFYDFARRADVIFASSRNLCEELSALRPNVHLSLNAGDWDHFAPAAEGGLPEPADLAAIPRPRLLTVGYSFHPRTDFAAVEYAARLRPQWQFVFVGKTDFPPGFGPCPNVHALGERPYADLPAYISHCQVCLAPYGLGVGWDYAFPKKMFEYLATGKPTVIIPLPEVLPYREVVRTPVTREEFVAAIEESLAEYDDPAAYAVAAERRRRVAAENTWEQRAELMIGVLQQMLAGREEVAENE